MPPFKGQAKANPTSQVKLIRNPDKKRVPPTIPKPAVENEESAPPTSLAQANIEVSTQELVFENTTHAFTEAPTPRLQPIGTPHQTEQLPMAPQHSKSPKTYHPSEQTQPAMMSGFLQGDGAGTSGFPGYVFENSSFHSREASHQPLPKNLFVETNSEQPPLCQLRNINGFDKSSAELSADAIQIKVGLSGKSFITWSRLNESPPLAEHKSLQPEEMQLLLNVHKAMNLLYGPIDLTPKFESIIKSNLVSSQSTAHPLSHVSANAPEFVPHSGQQQHPFMYEQQKFRGTRVPSTSAFVDRRYSQQPKPYYTQAPHQLPSQTIGQGQQHIPPHSHAQPGSGQVSQPHHQLGQIPQHGGTYPAMQMGYGGQQYVYPQMPQDAYAGVPYNMMYPMGMPVGQPMGHQMPHSNGGSYPPQK